MSESNAAAFIEIRPLARSDLASADRIMRLAFGTFIGLPEPESFMGDAAYVINRWRADRAAAFAATSRGTLVGSNFASNWGSVGFFGPLTIHPDYWDRGVGKRLLEPVLDCFERWGTTHAGLFTFPHSAKHVGLYQHFGFWPRFLTVVLTKRVDPSAKGPAWRRLSALPESESKDMIEACRALTDTVHAGLDLSREIRAVARFGLGDTLLLSDDAGLAAMAVCQWGAGTEAGSGTCYVKFGAARPGLHAAQAFARLLGACEALAREQGLDSMLAGVSTAREGAYHAMLAAGYRATLQGVAMHRPNTPGYSHPDAWVIDDWR